MANGMVDWEAYDVVMPHAVGEAVEMFALEEVHASAEPARVNRQSFGFTSHTFERQHMQRVPARWMNESGVGAGEVGSSTPKPLDRIAQRWWSALQAR